MIELSDNEKGQIIVYKNKSDVVNCHFCGSKRCELRYCSKLKIFSCVGCHPKFADLHPRGFRECHHPPVIGFVNKADEVPERSDLDRNEISEIERRDPKQ